MVGRTATLLIAAWIGLLGGCTRAVPADQSEQFLKIEQHFHAANSQDAFLRVAAEYQELIDSGLQSGVVFYNQGNAFVRAGRPGHAVASYRQALRFRPTDAQLWANLHGILKPTLSADDAPTFEIRRWLMQIFFWQDWLSFPAKFQLAFLAALLTFVLGTIALFRPHRLWRRTAGGVLLITMVFLASAALDWYRFDYQSHGVVVRDDVTVRKGNADSYQPLFQAKLGQTTEFVLRERRGEWLRVRLANGEEGWIRARDAIVY